MSMTKTCPECGVTLPIDAPLGLCPRCLPKGSASSTLAFGPGDQPRPAASDGVRIDLQEVLRAIRELGLVTADELDRIASVSDVDPARLARVLVRARKITSYQAGALLQGKARGLVIGDYLVETKLGTGGMGVVFKAKHRPSRRVVALKILPPSFGREPDAVRRFRREFQIASRLSHPNLVRAIEASEDRGVHYLTMEYIPGHTLHELVSTAGAMAVKLALHCAVQTARGLEAAHAQGVVHRDIKPGNVMIDPAGAVRVLDLGLARVIEATNQFGRSEAGSLTRTGTYMGTVDFLAPEQANDAKSADGRSDVYSLGCTLYFLLTGKPPFPGETILRRLMAHQDRPAPSLRASRPEVPEALEEVYLRMMAKRPADRPQTMSEVVMELEACRTSAREAGDASDELKTFARTIMKRAPARGRRGPDASIFAQPAAGSDDLGFDPNLDLEDLVADYRDMVPSKPIPEEKLPPIVRRPIPPPIRRRQSIPYGVVGLALLGLAVAGYTFRPGTKLQDLVSRESRNPEPTELRNPEPTESLVSPARAVTNSPPPKVEKPEFRSLFRGSDLNDWVAERSKLDDWRLNGGVLSFVGNGGREVKLLSRQGYTDFLLRVEFQDPPGADGGFFFIGPDGSRNTVVEVNVGGATSGQKSGDLWCSTLDSKFYFFKPTGPVDPRTGDDWNVMEADYRDGRLAFSINGKPMSYTANLSSVTGPRRIGFQLMQGPVRYRNLMLMDLTGKASVARPPRTLYFDEHPEVWRGDHEGQPRGQEKGVFYFTAKRPGDWGFGCPVINPPDFSCEMVGRVLPDGPDSKGSWGMELLRDPAGIQIRINHRGELWIEPSFRTVGKFPNEPPRVGPIIHPAIRPGNEYNTLEAKILAGRLEVVVNGVTVFQRAELAYAHHIHRIEKAIFCDQGSVRAEFDRVAIRELQSAAALEGKSANEPSPNRWDASTPSAVAALYEESQRLSDAERLREAVDLLEHALKTQRTLSAEHPERADYRKMLNTCRYSLSTHYSTYLDLQHRNPGRAIELSKEAVALQPDDPASWQGLGWALYSTGDWRGCINADEKSLSLSKQGTGWDWFFLAMAHRQLGEEALAKKSYEQGVGWLDKQAENATYYLKARRLRDRAAALLGIPVKR